MKIKSFLYAFLVALLLIPAAATAAEPSETAAVVELAEDEMALGDIRIGDTKEDVEARYGAGCNVAGGVMERDGEMVGCHVYDYGASLHVTYRMDADGAHVIGVHVGVNDVNKYIESPSEQARMIETPSGIRLDSTRADLMTAYGFVPKPKCGHTAPPVCGYFYDGGEAQLAFYICEEHSRGIRSIWLHERYEEAP